MYKNYGFENTLQFPHMGKIPLTPLLLSLYRLGKMLFSESLNDNPFRVTSFEIEISK